MKQATHPLNLKDPCIRKVHGIFCYLILLPLLAACSDNATPATFTGKDLAVVTPIAWPTLLPSPTADIPAVDVVPREDEPRLDPATATAIIAPTSTTPQEPAWSFVVTGDTWKDNPIWRRILSDAEAAGDDFIIVCGDITPQGRPEQFAEFAALAATVSMPVYAAPGNHDVAWSGDTTYFEQYFLRHHSFDHHNLHVTIADDSSHNFSADELAWLEADLAATTQPLKMVFMHVPPLLPYPVPAEDTMASGAPELMALLEKYGVQEMFAAHLQAYSRMERNGVAYTITGGGGSPLHVPAFLGGRYHYVRVTISGNTVDQEVVWLDDVATPTP